MRGVLAVLGAAVAGYGGWRLLDTQDTRQVLLVGVWLVAGVVVHDAVLAPAAVVLGRLGRPLPRAVAAGGVVVLVVLGSVTLVGIPVLGGFGADPDNPTLHDRDYLAGWLVLAAASAVAGALVAAAAGRRGLRSRTPGGRSADGQGAGRR